MDLPSPLPAANRASSRTYSLENNENFAAKVKSNFFHAHIPRPSVYDEHLVKGPTASRQLQPVLVEA